MRRILVIAAVLVGLTAKAQTPFAKEVEWGPEEKVKFSQKHPDIIGEKGGKIYGVSRNPYGKIYLHTISEGSMSIEETVKLGLDYDGNKLELIDAFIFGEELVFLTAYRNKEKEMKFFFVQKYESAGKLSTPVPVGKTDWSKVPGYFSMKKDRFEAINILKIDISDNKKYLSLVYPNNIVPEEGEKNIWQAVVLDESLEEVWKYEFELANNELNVNTAKVNDDGVVFASSVNNKSKNARSKFWQSAYYDFQNANFLNCLIGDAYYLEVVDGQNKNHKHVDLGLEDQNFIGMSMDVKADKVVFYGLAKKSEEQGTSSFIKILNDKGDELSTTYSEIDMDFFISKRFKNKLFTKKVDDKALKRFFLKDLYLTDKGDFVFIAEEFQYYVTTQYDAASKTYTDYDHFEYGDLLLFSYNAQGELNWMNRYEKYQHTINDLGYFGSYYSVMKDGSIYIIANTKEYSVKEEELDEGPGKDKRKAKRRTIIAWITIDENGTMTDDVLITKEQLERHSMSVRYGAINEGTFYAASNYFKGILSTGQLAMGKIGVSL